MKQYYRIQGWCTFKVQEIFGSSTVRHQMLWRVEKLIVLSRIVLNALQIASISQGAETSCHLSYLEAVSNFSHIDGLWSIHARNGSKISRLNLLREYLTFRWENTWPEKSCIPMLFWQDRFLRNENWRVAPLIVPLCCNSLPTQLNSAGTQCSNWYMETERTSSFISHVKFSHWKCFLDHHIM